MKIAINSRVLTERKGGPARYTLNIIRELSFLDSKNNYFILLNRPYDFPFKLPDNFKKIVLKTGSRFIFDYLYLSFFSWIHRFDIWLFPKNTFSPFIRGEKIPVYHDIIYFEKNIKFREYKFFDNLHHTIMIPIDARFSTRDVTVSDFTASRMRELLNIPQSNIKVIKEGVEKTFRIINKKHALDDVINKYNIRRPFFFYSGSLSPRKNMIRVLEAFVKIKDHVPHHLYFTGGDSWRDNEVFEFIISKKLSERVIKLGRLSEEELVAMYNLADCYLFPSLYEGFGLPILEAQACGCPVITSNIASCPEVAGEGAILVDPRNVDDIASAMLKISKTRSLRNKLIKKGLQNCSTYRWERTAVELLNLFNEIVILDK